MYKCTVLVPWKVLLYELFGFFLQTFQAPSFDDKILEVVAVFGSVQMAMSRVIDIQHHRIAQVGHKKTVQQIQHTIDTVNNSAKGDSSVVSLIFMGFNFYGFSKILCRVSVNLWTIALSVNSIFIYHSSMDQRVSHILIKPQCMYAGINIQWDKRVHVTSCSAVVWRSPSWGMKRCQHRWTERRGCSPQGTSTSSTRTVHKCWPGTG